MLKNIAKIESVDEFLARGGVVTQCPTKNKARRMKRAIKEAKMEEVDWSVLPENLKIRFGIRSEQE
jgi:hypothetical protein